MQLMLLKCNLAGSARTSAADHHGPLGIRILIPDGPDPCGRSGVRALAPRSTGVTTILSASPRQPLLYVHRHGTLKPPALLHVKHVSHLRHQMHRTTLRCTRIHRFQTAAIFYQNFYPNRQLIGADMLYVLVTAASWHGLPRVSPAFQAGYAGSIPVARSQAKRRLRGP